MVAQTDPLLISWKQAVIVLEDDVNYSFDAVDDMDVGLAEGDLNEADNRFVEPGKFLSSEDEINSVENFLNNFQPTSVEDHVQTCPTGVQQSQIPDLHETHLEFEAVTKIKPQVNPHLWKKLQCIEANRTSPPESPVTSAPSSPAPSDNSKTNAYINSKKKKREPVRDYRGPKDHPLDAKLKRIFSDTDLRADNFRYRVKDMGLTDEEIIRAKQLRRRSKCIIYSGDTRKRARAREGKGSKRRKPQAAKKYKQ
eukprot:m.14122 g.14122  ORF g.14122 m.14122 type:complete len:253 (+) comp4991_c0_seq1:282-1040(+)